MTPRERFAMIPGCATEAESAAWVAECDRKEQASAAYEAVATHYRRMRAEIDALAREVDAAFAVYAGIDTDEAAEVRERGDAFDRENARRVRGGKRPLAWDEAHPCANDY